MRKIIITFGIILTCSYLTVAAQQPSCPTTVTATLDAYGCPLGTYLIKLQPTFNKLGSCHFDGRFCKNWHSACPAGLGNQPPHSCIEYTVFATSDNMTLLTPPSSKIKNIEDARMQCGETNRHYVGPRLVVRIITDENHTQAVITTDHFKTYINGGVACVPHVEKKKWFKF